MEFIKEEKAVSQVDADLIVLPIIQDENVDAALKQADQLIDEEFISLVAQQCQQDDFTGKPGQMIQLPTYGRMRAKSLIMRGLGKSGALDASAMRKCAASVSRRLSQGSTAATVCLVMRTGSTGKLVQASVEGWLLGAYQFTKYKTRKEDKKPVEIRRLSMSHSAISDQEFSESTATGNAIARATNFARDLVAEPPSYMTPTRLAQAAAAIATDTMQVEVLDSEMAGKQGMGAFLGVARGASEPAKVIIMHYVHPGAGKTIGLAGKGITFDSGGLSIKTALSMEHMKYDMSGAAAVLAAMKVVGELKPAVNVIAVAVASENMPGPSALHPGDVLTAMNGKTIEVNNTDAEGRLVLADALCYLCKAKVDEIVDIATLTAAVGAALGRAAAGIMGNNQALIDRISESGVAAGERYWQLPLFDEYKEALKSEIADLKNAGARGEAGSSAAGMFLKEFVDDIPWAHLDIAGTAWLEKERDELNKGGTAFGVRTLAYYLLSQSGAQSAKG